MKQLALFATESKKKFYGGELVKGRRKQRRPLDRNKPLHLTLKARRLLYPHRQFVHAQARTYAAKFGIRLYSVAVSGDHVHLLMRIAGRSGYNAFVRSLAARLARVFGKGVWALLPFSRVLSWGKDFKNLQSYLQKNRDEAAGNRDYEPRRDWYKKQRRKTARSRPARAAHP